MAIYYASHDYLYPPTIPTAGRVSSRTGVPANCAIPSSHPQVALGPGQLSPILRPHTGSEDYMITYNEYMELCGGVYQPSESVRRILWEYAAKIVDDSERMGLRPHGGGGHAEHYAGKIGEACFEYYLHGNRVYYVPCCRGLFDDGSNHVDYLVYNGSVFQSFDVKSGLLPTIMDFGQVPLDRYGLTVPVLQARRRDVDAYAHCFIKLDGEAPRAVLAGWAYAWEVLEAPVYRGRGGKPDFYCLPVQKLRHPNELVVANVLAGASLESG